MTFGPLLECCQLQKVHLCVLKQDGLDITGQSALFSIDVTLDNYDAEKEYIGLL